MPGQGVKGRVFLTFLIVVALIHSTIHFVAYGTGIAGFAQNGLSGYATGKSTLGEEIKSLYPISLPSSRIVVIVEWSAIVLGLVFVLLKQHKQAPNIPQTLLKIPSAQPLTKDLLQTDLDRLFTLLKTQKRIKLSSVTQLFSVDKEVAMNWGRTLEGGDFIVIQYPTFGEPEFVFKEEIKVESVKKK